MPTHGPAPPRIAVLPTLPYRRAVGGTPDRNLPRETIPMSTNEEIANRGLDVLVGNYAPQPVALVRGEGSWLFDAEGNKFLDLMGGIATATLGHANPKLQAALADQASKVWHVSNLYTTEPQIQLAERITASAGTAARWKRNKTSTMFVQWIELQTAGACAAYNATRATIAAPRVSRPGSNMVSRPRNVSAYA